MHLNYNFLKYHFWVEVLNIKMNESPDSPIILTAFQVTEKLLGIYFTFAAWLLDHFCRVQVIAVNLPSSLK